MTKRQDAVKAWEKILNSKQDTQIIRFALTGDGSDAETSDVDGKPGWAWVRYDEKQDKASQILNAIFPGIGQDVPVVIGKRYPTDRFFQILGINIELYLQSLTTGAYTAYILPPHGSTHTAGTGSDWAPIVTGNILNGLCRRTNPASLSVFVEYIIYDNSGILTTWGGGNIDLTSDIPTTAGLHRYAVVCIVPASNTLTAVLGLESPVPVAPTLPTIPAGYIPTGAVILENGITTIVDSRIYDYRLLFNSAGGQILLMNKLMGQLASEIDFTLSRHIVEGL